MVVLNLMVMKQTSPDDLPLFARSRHVYTVSDLLQKINDTLDERFQFVWVEGEVVGWRRAASGHLYFSLQDESGQIRAVCFRWQAARLNYVPVNGDQVLILGRVNLYAARGDLQLVVDTIEPRGAGALMAAFVALKAKLDKEGLLDEARKRPLPIPVRRIGLITSAEGAAVQDFLRTIHPTGPVFDIQIYPVPVQGEAAPPRLIEALEYFNRTRDVDVVVLTRGGGSVEDLWAFNHEGLARTVASSELVTISAVGHETDFTICDFVADVRAATPTAAAALLASGRRELRRQVDGLAQEMARYLSAQVSDFRWRLTAARQGLKDPRRRLGEQGQRLDELRGRLERLAGRIITGARQRTGFAASRLRAVSPDRRVAQARRDLGRLENDLTRLVRARNDRNRRDLAALTQRLEALSPLAVLSRGYAIVLADDGQRIVRRANSVAVGERLAVRLHQGGLGVVVDEVN